MSLLSPSALAQVQAAIGAVCETFFTTEVELVRVSRTLDEHGEIESETEATTSLLCYRQHASEAAKDDRFIQQHGVSLEVELKLTFDAQALARAGLYDVPTKSHGFEATDLFRIAGEDYELVKAAPTADFIAQDLLVLVYCRRKL